MWALTWPSPSKRSTASSYGGDARSATPPRPGSAATWCRPAADLGDPGRRLPPTPGDRRRRPSAHAPRRLAHEAVVQVVAGNAPQRPNGPPKPPPPAGPCRYFQASPSAARPRCSVGARPTNRRARSSVRRRNSTIRTMLPPTQGTAGAARQSSASPVAKTTTPEPGLALRAQSPSLASSADGPRGLDPSRARSRLPGAQPEHRAETVCNGHERSSGAQVNGHMTPSAILDVEEVRSSIPAAEVASLAGSHPKPCRKVPGHRIPRSAWDLRARRAVRGGSEP